MPIVYDNKYEELVGRSLEVLRSTTDISQLTPGAKARALIEIMNREVGNAFSTFSTDMLQAFARYAAGENLDLLGEFVGMPRLQAEQNEVSSDVEVQRFYVENGTFGDINLVGGVPTTFYIPVGTRVFTNSEDGEEPVEYGIAEQVTCNQAATESWASIKAVDIGIVSDIGAGSLRNHDFSLYADYLNLSLKTNNVEGITFSRDTESDDQYRFRIINQSLIGEAGNLTACRVAVLTVPGVADVRHDEYGRGIGTGFFFIKGTVSAPSDYLRLACQDAINEVRCFGNLIEARFPTLIGTEFEIDLYLLDTALGEDERIALKAAVRNRVYLYINGLDIGESLSQDLLVREIRAVDGNILRVGEREQNIKLFAIHKDGPAEDNRVRHLGFDAADYTVTPFERIVIEYEPLLDDKDPIVIGIAN